MCEKNSVEPWGGRLFDGLFVVFAVCFCWFPSLYIGMVPLRSYVLFAAFCFGLPMLIDKIRQKNEHYINRELKILFSFFFLFTVLRVINFFFVDYPVQKYWLYTLKYLVQPLLIFCSTYIFLRKNGTTKFINIMYVLIGVSSLIAFMQYLNVEFFWKLRDFFGRDPDPFVRKVLLEGTRGVGFAQYYIPLAYQIGAVFCFVYKGMILGKKIWINLFLAVVFTLGALSSGTRSVLFGIFVGLAYLFIVQSRYRKHIFLLGLTVIISAACFSLKGLAKKQSIRSFSIDGSAQLRKPLYYYYLEKLTHGENEGLLENKKEFVAFARDGGVDAYIGAEYSPHNQFLNTMFFYGRAAIILMIGFYVFLWYVTRQEICAWLRFGLIITFANAFFHNAGPFFGDYFWWFFAALLFMREKQQAYDYGK